MGMQPSVELNPPRYPVFSNYQARINTFVNWSNYVVQPNALAAAGFLYTGTDYEIYRDLKSCKNENFQRKIFDIFLIFVRNIESWYTLEPPRRGYKLHGHVFLVRTSITSGIMTSDKSCSDVTIYNCNRPR